MELTISPLAETDADELGRLHVAIWREAYAGIVPADQLAALDPVARAEGWRRISRQPSPGARTFVARDGSGDLVGFASAGPCRDDDPPTADELWAVYVLARTRGSGAADALVDRVLGALDACLWVFEANARARAFYRRLGFVEDGTAATHDGTQAPEVRMVRRGNRPAARGV